jgi:predicted subunit of tRNA(5-methylaminomethyl-2-thiouridylate) methyltransferase
MIRMIQVSDEIFDRVIARALEVAEEQFRRMVFDTGMRAEAVQLFHDQVVDALAERYVDKLTDRILEEVDPEWVRKRDEARQRSEMKRAMECTR